MYNSNNDLVEVHNAATGSLIWKLGDVNDKGQLAYAFLGKQQVDYKYDSNDRLRRIMPRE